MSGMEMANEGTEFVVIGCLSGLYGIKGWVRVFSYTRPRENILQYSPWYVQINQGWQELVPVGGRRQGKGIIVQLEGYSDRDRAKGLLGSEIAIRRSQLPKSERDEPYWVEMIGLQVVTTQGTVLGTVQEVIETGANDVLMVQGEREHLIPFVRSVYIIEVDQLNRCIEVDWEPDF